MLDILEKSLPCLKVVYRNFELEEKVSVVEEAYLYNGKEKIGGGIGLNWLDYGARYYDNAIGIWMSVDALVYHPNQLDKSPYAYGWNNPIVLTDPDGNCPLCWNFAIGFGLDVASQMLFEGEKIRDVSFGKATVAGGVNMFSGLGAITKFSKLNKFNKIAVDAVADSAESVVKQLVEDRKVIGEDLLSDILMAAAGSKASLKL